MRINFEKVSYVYDDNTPFKFAALDAVDLDIKLNRVTAIIGNTGSGKSTLVQHLNALLKPTSGILHILDRVIVANEKPKDLKSLRKEVGLVFQFPEYQLFEETILKDVSFGPKNFNVSESEAIEDAKKALALVGIDESYYERSPLDLSGGQKRRIAIAGILAMNPQILVLDEPTAGLDPQGAKQMMELFVSLNKEHHKTVLIVTHDLDHVLNYCDDVVLLKDGKALYHNDVKSFFKDASVWQDFNIEKPNIIKAKDRLIAKGFKIDEDCFTIDQLINCIKGGYHG